MGTLLVEGKTLFPRASQKAQPPGLSLMIDRVLSLAAETGIVTSLALLEIDPSTSSGHREAWVLQNEFGPNEFQRVLKTLAGLLHKQTPNELLFDRWGPAGFFYLHPGAGLTQTTEVLEKLQNLLHTRLKRLFPGKPATFSAGLAAFPQHGDTRIEILRRAEEALYVARQTGKGAIQLPPDEELQQVSVPLSPVQVDRLSNLAKREGTSAQELIREAVDEFLRRSQFDEL